MNDDAVPALIDHDGSSRVPLTILTGFLGAGKSTLLQHILTAQHGYKIAVIMNEFSNSADIEARTINVTSENDPSALSEEVLELANGCLCCSIKDSGIASIENMMKKRGRFDYILLETTGLADPGPIASMFWDNESMSDALYLDGVVCLVDGVYGLSTIKHDTDELNIGARQVACADIVLLNKIDIASTESLTKTESLIRSINAAVPIHRTSHGSISVGQILNLNAYSALPTHVPSVVHDEDGHDSKEHDHFAGISSLVIPLPALSSVEVDKFDEWLRTLLWEGQLLDDDSEKLEVLRCKGIYSTTPENHIFVIQGVRELYDVKDVTGTNEAGPTMGKLALIGSLGSDPAKLTRSLQKALGQ